MANCGKANIRGKLMEYCLCWSISVPTFPLHCGLETSQERGYMAILISQRFSQIRETLGRLLSHLLNFKCLQLKIRGIFWGVIFRSLILYTHTHLSKAEELNSIHSGRTASHTFSTWLTLRLKLLSSLLVTKFQPYYSPCIF